MWKGVHHHMSLENCKLKWWDITIRMAKIKTQIALSADKDVEQRNLWLLAGGNEKWYSPLRRESSSFLQNETHSYYTIQPAHSLGNAQRSRNLCPHKNLHIDVYSNFIHTCQNWEVTKVPFSRWMDKPCYLWWPGVSEDEPGEHTGFLGQWNYSAWHDNGGWIYITWLSKPIECITQRLNPNAKVDFS